MNNPFDIFDEIWCINLDHRTDRWEHAQLEFKKVGINDRVQRFSAIRDDDGRLGLIKSFQSLFEYAQNKKLNNIFIFEDDVKFINNPNENMKKAVEQSKNIDWDMFYLGANTHNKLIKIKPNLVLLKNAYSAHAIGYNKSLFDTVVELVPAKATLIMGTVYEQNLLRRNRVKLMNPEEATNYKQYIFPVDGRPNNFMESFADNDSYDAGSIQIAKQFEFDKNELDDLSGHIQALITFPSEGFDLYEFGEIVYRLNPYNIETYNDGAVNRQRYNADRYRNFAGNTKNSSLTSYDRGPVVVITSSNPKKLIVNYADNPKLLVK